MESGLFIIMSNKLTFFFLILLILAHVFILTRLLFSPYPELFIYPYLTNHGLKPYSQILDQHFPGLMFLPINLDNLGMNTAEEARLWSIAIVIVVHLLLFFIVGRLLKSKTKALLASVLYLIWQPFFEGWVLWIDSFLPIILLLAFFALIKKKIFLTGLLLGVGIVFKQTLIPLSLMLLVYIYWHSRKIRPTLTYLCGLMIPIAGMLLYISSIGVLKDFWYWTVVFNLTVFARTGTSLPNSVGFVTRPLLVYGMSSLLFFYRDKKLSAIIFIFLLGSIIGIFDRADFVHFQPSLPFATLATVLGIYQFGHKNILKFILFVYFIIAFWWLGIFYKGHLGNRVLFFDADTKALASKIKSYTHPQEKIFIFGSVPHLYQMTRTLPTGNVFVFQFPWFIKVAQNRLLEGIKKDRPNIIVSDRTVKIENQSITEFAKEIDQYINEKYDLVEQVGTAAILRRKIY